MRCVALGCVIAFIGAAFAPSARAADAWGQPLVVLTSASRGDTDLIFALYASGRVLSVAPGSNDYSHYRLATLTDSQRRALLAGLPLAAVGRMHPPRRLGQDGSIDCIRVFEHRHERHDCLWGLMWDVDGPAMKPAPPSGMLEIWRRLTRFDSSSWQPWTPELLHVIATQVRGDNVCARQEPLPWPLRWPHPPAQIPQLHFRIVPSELPDLRRTNPALACAPLVGDMTDPRVIFVTNAYPHDELWLPAGD